MGLMHVKIRLRSGRDYVALLEDEMRKNKKITINEKLLEKIKDILSGTLCLSNLEEFNEDYKLFEDRPEHWTELETQLCDYTVRIQGEIFSGIRDLLINGNAR